MLSLCIARVRQVHRHNQRQTRVRGDVIPLWLQTCVFVDALESARARVRWRRCKTGVRIVRARQQQTLGVHAHKTQIICYTLLERQRDRLLFVSADISISRRRRPLGVNYMPCLSHIKSINFANLLFLLILSCYLAASTSFTIHCVHMFNEHFIV